MPGGSAAAAILPGTTPGPTAPRRPPRSWRAAGIAGARLPDMSRALPAAVELLISDVDGTLVTGNKQLTPRSQSAVRALAEAGIRFAVTSSRPAIGLRMLI